MGVLFVVNDLFQIPAQVGERKISITIETSSRSHPSVRFEFYKSDCHWMSYWVFEPSFRDISLIAERLHIRHLKWSEVRDRLDFRAALRDCNPVYSHGVDTETGKILEKLCENGLLAPTVNRFGFDGHDYSIAIDGFPKEFRCWRILPEEWKHLKSLIDKCILYAKIEQEYYGCSIFNRTGK